MTITLLVIAAILIEAVVETFKLIYDSDTHKLSIAVLLSLAIGIAISLIGRFGLFGLAGITTIPWVADAICTGIILSRGSNYLHTLLAQKQDIFIALPDDSAETATTAVAEETKQTDA